MSYHMPRLPRGVGGPATHPLCICPPLTWRALSGAEPPPDVTACRTQSHGITHPVLSAADVAALIARLRTPPEAP